MARGVPLRFFRESCPQISNRKGCLHKICSRNISPNPKSQWVSPEDVSERSRGVPQRFVRESSPQITNFKQCHPKIFQTSPASNRKGFPPKMFRATSSQISNHKGCPAEIFLKSHPPPHISSRKGCPPKSRKGCPPKFFSRQSSQQISICKGFPLKIFQRIVFPNLKSQGVSP